MKCCFMFGHRDVPEAILKKLIQSVERLYLEENITIFYVERYGMFDRYAGTAVKTVRKQFPEISLYQVTPYHPAVRPITLPDGYDGSFYPPLEGVPQRYAIVRANQYMVKTFDAVICYVKHSGNSKALLELALRREQNDQLIIENIGQCFVQMPKRNCTKHEPVMICTQSIQMDRICALNYLDPCPPTEPASWEVRWQL